MKSIMKYILCVQLGVVAAATAQGTSGSGHNSITITLDGEPASEPAPKSVKVKTVSFDAKSKLNTAYSKILSDAKQTFEERLATAMIMERWEDVANLMTEADVTQRRRLALKTLEEASKKVNIPMTWVIKILETSEGKLSQTEYRTLISIIKKTLSSFGGKDLLSRQFQTASSESAAPTMKGEKRPMDSFWNWVCMMRRPNT